MFIKQTRLRALQCLLGAYAASAFTFKFPDCTTAPLTGNGVCDMTKDPVTRATAIVSQFTVPELINSTWNQAPAITRLGIPGYNWWSEALHGVATSQGVSFAAAGQNFSYATSFPQPIVMGSAFDDPLIKAVADVVSTEARAFSNIGRAGLDFWTPNINPFRDPRWGRGQETPGEDPFHISQYVFNLVQGLQGGIDPVNYKVVADCKHFAAYDIESSRTSFNAVVTPQDLSEFYLPPFQSCVRDAKVASVMCSYNSVNGIPSCANSYLLQTLLRDYWGFNDVGRWVTSDCDAIDNIFSTHHYTADYPHTVADALKAGTDLDCGSTYTTYLPAAFNQTLITRDDLQRSVVRLFSSLVRLGWFDDPTKQPLRQLTWSAVNTASSQALAYQAAVEGIVLLKNDGTLPFKSTVKKIAFIGPMANATTQMQGNYFGNAPFLISPAQGATLAGFTTTITNGTTVSGNTTDGFAAALAAAQAADAIVFAGGIDETIESESRDRKDITWPGNQLQLISQLAALKKPFVVMQFGGGQVDDSALKSNAQVNAILWAGYPGQSGGAALGDIIAGKAAPAGRLSTTQYPAAYTSVPITDMTLRPNGTNPGRTYKWYSGTPVFPFGHGLHYTTFSLTWQNQPASTYTTASLVPSGSSGVKTLDLNTFDTFNVTVRNTGNVTSDYVALLFLSTTAGPSPQPKKELVGYTRLHQIKAGQTAVAAVKVTLGSIARADAQGNHWIYTGNYLLTVDTGVQISLTHNFTITGTSAQISQFPQNSA